MPCYPSFPFAFKKFLAHSLTFWVLCSTKLNPENNLRMPLGVIYSSILSEVRCPYKIWPFNDFLISKHSHIQYPILPTLVKAPHSINLHCNPHITVIYWNTSPCPTSVMLFPLKTLELYQIARMFQEHSIKICECMQNILKFNFIQIRNLSKSVYFQIRYKCQSRNRLSRFDAAEQIYKCLRQLRKP